MPFTRSGTEYDGIDKALATSVFGPWSGRLKKLRKELAKEQMVKVDQADSESRHQRRRSEQLQDYATKSSIDEARKKRLSQSGLSAK